MKTNISATIIYTAAGWCLEWYRETARGEGRVARWYAGRCGDRAACEARAKLPPPHHASSMWVPCGGGDGGPPYDAATATGMYD